MSCCYRWPPAIVVAGKYASTGAECTGLARVPSQLSQELLIRSRGTLCKQLARPAGKAGSKGSGVWTVRANIEDGVQTVVTPRSASAPASAAPPLLPADWETAEVRPEGLGMAVLDAGKEGDERSGHPQSTLRFVKYHGLGNDFLLVDNRDSDTPKITPDQAIKVCDRNFGVGGDGVIFVLPGTAGTDFTMRIYNSDGSEPEMCGNGIRCVAKFVAELDGTTKSRSYNVSTLGGLMVPKLLDDGQVCVDMGPPILDADKIPTKLEPGQDGAVVKAPLLVNGKTWNVTCVSMGNPHCIVILDDTEELSDLPLSSIGPLFEKHDVFPARTNTEFVQVLSRSSLRMRVWERGAGATLACGTGACALVVAAVLEGRAERKCHVELPGGPLEIEWGEDNHLYMTGPAQKVFAGTAYL